MNFKTTPQIVKTLAFQIWLSTTLFNTTIALVFIHLYVAPFVVMVAFDSFYTLGSCPGINAFKIVFYGLILVAIISFVTLLYLVINCWQKKKKIFFFFLTYAISGLVVGIVGVYLFSHLLLKLEASIICNCKFSIQELDRSVACSFLDKIE